LFGGPPSYFRDDIVAFPFKRRVPERLESFNHVVNDVRWSEAVRLETVAASKVYFAVEETP